MKELLTEAMHGVEYPHPFKVIYPDGSLLERGAGEPVFTIHFKTDRALFDTLRRVALGFGEGYMSEEIDIHGDLQQMIRVGFMVADHYVQPSLLTKLKVGIDYLTRRNTLQGSRKNIAAHYDLGNEFYSLWLDREAKQYTCAYFSGEKDSIEKAQLQKLDLVCRKVRLKPGDTVVEAGCGWGGFALHAARNYGAKVRAYNISREQIAYAREKAQRLGVPESRVEYVLDDYRNIGQDGRTYDKFVSIGMFEHVGKENYRNFYDLIRRVLRPNGMALVHSISRVAPTPMDPWLEKYIFPGAYIPSLAEMVTPVERRHDPLHIVDVENLRYHYALTLDAWAERLEEHADSIRERYSESFLRMFRFYLHASAAGFRHGGILLYQLLLSNGFDDSAPLTRSHFIAGAETARSRSNGRGPKNGAVRAGKKVSARAGSAKSARRAPAARSASKKKAARR